MSPEVVKHRLPEVIKHRFICSTVHIFHNFLHNIKLYTNIQMLRDFIKSLNLLCLWEKSKNVNINSFFPAMKVS